MSWWRSVPPKDPYADEAARAPVSFGGPPPQPHNYLHVPEYHYFHGHTDTSSYSGQGAPSLPYENPTLHYGHSGREIQAQSSAQDRVPESTTVVSWKGIYLQKSLHNHWLTDGNRTVPVEGELAGTIEFLMSKPKSVSMEYDRLIANNKKTLKRYFKEFGYDAVHSTHHKGKKYFVLDPT